MSLKLFVSFVYRGRSSSRGQNLGSAQPPHFAQGQAYVRPLEGSDHSSISRGCILGIL
jgi:hypothetical protein